jgi:DNA-binding GntR family transcriptional regulator
MQIQHQAVTKQTFRVTLECHEKLLSALRGGDPEVAERTIRTDLEGWDRMIRDPFQVGS